jgi:hypothetical protein
MRLTVSRVICTYMKLFRVNGKLHAKKMSSPEAPQAVGSLTDNAMKSYLTDTPSPKKSRENLSTEESRGGGAKFRDLQVVLRSDSISRCPPNKLVPNRTQGLPDVTFSNQKSKFG